MIESVVFGCVDGVCGGWLYNGIWLLVVDGDVVVVVLMVFV